ncbi:hypothetical protein NM208_g14199 [Fusarium decemcellulare]|uniref:Uncharacterized protein n=1 Tax=Fusarium decemcellulare TaxID=57161 RepID=A0ACC1RH00_9HYPO|nr:hypothetical protein NM208_g14199 [Fusarium decemcellulare]
MALFASAIPEDFSLTSAAYLLIGMFFLFRLGLVVWRLFFHPLAGFPGPKLYASSYLPFLVQNMLKGTLVKDVLALHDKYGPILRISPNRLSIDGSIGWSEIYARRADQPEFDKTVDFFGTPERVGLLNSLREDHRRQRRLISHAFSKAALKEQESYIQHYLDLLMTRLGENAAAGRPMDVTRWFNFFTFDLIGELAFGDPFYSLEKSDYHPWVTMLFQGIKGVAKLKFLNHYPLLRPLIYLLMDKRDIQVKQETTRLAESKAEKRVAQGADARKDFLTYILRHNADGRGMTHRELVINSRALIIAGSETTATALSGLTFHLTLNKRAYMRLVEEIRSAFASESDINMDSTAPLTYLGACLEETLRIYPPVGETPPRISPGDFVGDHYIPKGTIVSIYQWATHHSSRNFLDPELFAPERFLPATHPLHEARYASDNKAAFKPFSVGPRDCIGKNLAYAELRMVVSRLLWTFDLEIVEGQEDWVSRQRTFTVHDKGPLMIRLKPRN